MNATNQRDSIPHVAEKDWKKAREIAVKISDPWFKCQALTKVADYAPDKESRLHLIDSALLAASECESPNRRVTVASWPIKAMISLGYSEQISLPVRKLLNGIGTENSPVRRADALSMLLGAISELQAELFWEVYDEFLAACTCVLSSGKRNSKGEGLLAGWAGHVYRRCEKRGLILVESIRGPEHRRRAEKQIQLNGSTISWPNL